MLPDRVSNPGPLTYESGALPVALRGPAQYFRHIKRWKGDNERFCGMEAIYGLKDFRLRQFSNPGPLDQLATR